jgi:hypothetical protein
MQEIARAMVAQVHRTDARRTEGLPSKSASRVQQHGWRPTFYESG